MTGETSDYKVEMPFHVSPLVIAHDIPLSKKKEPKGATYYEKYKVEKHPF